MVVLLRSLSFISVLTALVLMTVVVVTGLVTTACVTVIIITFDTAPVIDTVNVTLSYYYCWHDVVCSKLA